MESQRAKKIEHYKKVFAPVDTGIEFAKKSISRNNSITRRNIKRKTKSKKKTTTLLHIAT